MGFREWINRNPIATTVVFVVVLIGAVGYISLNVFTPGRYEEMYAYAFFYDVSTGELFVEDNMVIPPIRDGNGVKAVVFSCSDCSDADTHFIGWLETYSEQGKQALENPLPPDPEAEANPNAAAEIAGGGIGGDSFLIAAKPQMGQPAQWLPAGSYEAAQLRISYNSRCGGERPDNCLPRDVGLP